MMYRWLSLIGGLFKITPFTAPSKRTFYIFIIFQNTSQGHTSYTKKTSWRCCHQYIPLSGLASRRSIYFPALNGIFWSLTQSKFDVCPTSRESLTVTVLSRVWCDRAVGPATWRAKLTLLSAKMELVTTTLLSGHVKIP